MKRLIFFAPLSLFVAAAIVLMMRLSGAEPPPAPGALVGQPFPVAELAGLSPDAPGWSSEDITGETVVINVFASWCTPCRAEHPILMALADRGVTLYGVAWKDAPENAAGFLDELGDPFTAVGIDPQGRFGQALGVTGAPETLVVGPDGIVRAHWQGPLDPRTVQRVIAPALQAAAS